MSITPLPTILYADTMRLALAEDLGRVGDITTTATVGSGTQAVFNIVARQAGTIAGQEVARETYRLVDTGVRYTSMVSDGARVIAGQEVASISGQAASILTAERVALNFLGHLVASPPRRRNWWTPWLAQALRSPARGKLRRV
ncbi:hypothetical protein [Ornithinimicrobium sp. INDO-MA30-4]|uniref:hypothetical protein n=1 Tax=Ornithinimicrobium sp. INDO-MA30-4 TaxID=2908651 RepID=UPI001F2CCCF9|nr:hypothetical protein [Ornithinimicrobium sp. INDO-MA30-4]UJH70814.1 hypothetical protein L0A91_02010 [Ornithinimicrobium sp. INDO-MA30-4]